MKIYKASSVGAEAVPDLELRATETAPEIGPIISWEEAYRRFYYVQGVEIVRQLRASLPGGTIDGILLALLESKASLLRVPDPEPKKRPRAKPDGEPHVSVNREFRLIFDDEDWADDAPSKEEVLGLVETIKTIRGVFSVEAIHREGEWGLGDGTYGIGWAPKTTTVRDLREALAPLSDDMPVEVDAYNESPEKSITGPLTVYSLEAIDNNDGRKDAPMKFVIGTSIYVHEDDVQDGEEEDDDQVS